MRCELLLNERQVGIGDYLHLNINRAFDGRINCFRIIFKKLKMKLKLS